MYKKQLFYLVLVATAIRLLLASVLEFGNDEAYYYTYALHLQPNYFDHPPGVAVLIRLFTLNLHLQSEIFVRLGAIVFAAVATIFCFKIGALLCNERTGWFAAILYNTSIYSSIIAGTFILPDSPQLVCWLAAVYVLLLLLQESTQKNKIVYWLLFGGLTGACIMCKVHGVFLWIGFGAYIIFYKRKFLREPWLYISFLITLISISPVFLWNLHNHFITWRYHSQRLEVNRFAIDMASFIQTVFGQLFYNNPLNVVAMVIALLYARRHTIISATYQRILLCCGFPIIITVMFISVFKDVLPHWSGPGFVTLSFITAAYFDEKIPAGKNLFWPSFFKATTLFLLVVIIAGIALIKFYPGTIGHTKSKQQYGETDFTLDMYGWKAFGEAFIAWEKQAVRQKQIPSNLLFVCNKWFPAAHIDYYVAAPLQTQVIGIGQLNDLHHFAWLNHYRKKLGKNEDALCIIPGNYAEDAEKVYGPYFKQVRLLQVFRQQRMHATARYFFVYLLKGYKANDETRLMPVK